MIYALAILIVTAAICYLLSFAANNVTIARVIALLGVISALGVALWFEDLQGGGIRSAPIVWPDFMNWLGPSFYRSDTLAAGLSAWCIAFGGFCLLKLGNGEETARKLAASILLVATLYSLVYTADLRAFAAQVLLIVLLTWAVLWGENSPAPFIARQRAAQLIGVAALLVGVLIIGRTTGGIYSLTDLSLSALTFWPLLLIVVFVVFWIGLAPFTGWGASIQDGTDNGAQGALVQGLVLGIPVLVLVLRLQALITDQSIAGSVPTDWETFMGALVWLGGITTLTAACCTVVWAGTARWSAGLSACILGGAVWGLGLDTPTGRYAAIAIVLAFGAGKLALELSIGRYGWLARLAAGLSLVGVPITAGFVGIWLLASGLVESRHASLAIVAAGSAIVAACGTALHLAVPGTKLKMQDNRYEVGLGYFALGATYLVLVLGGALPGLWLPQVEAMASIAGGDARLGTGWTGVISGGLFSPLTLLAIALLVLGLLGWLMRVWVKSRTAGNSVLLPTATARLQKIGEAATTTTQQPLISNPPPAVWWLSLTWLETGLYGSGSLLSRILSRLGILLARLEGRYYFPLALILTLLIILAITR